jgi:3-hydroxypropionyl-coenzyme A dehydratase
VLERRPDRAGTRFGASLQRAAQANEEVFVSEPSTIRTDFRERGIALLTLDRPEKRNALSLWVREQIVETLKAWRDDGAVRVVVLTGAPPAFCAGFDLEEFGAPALARAIRYSSTAYHHTVWSFPKPVVAAVNGPALGGGFDLSLLCDLRIASTEAVFAHPEVKLGAPPLFTPLRWIVGDGLARDLCLTGRRIGAEEAERIGLVSRVVEPERLLDAALEVAGTIAEAPQRCLETTKRYLFGNSGLGFDDSFRIEHDDVFDVLLTGEQDFVS